MSDAYTEILRKTSAPLPQSLSKLRYERHMAERELSRGGGQSFHGEQWSRRIERIDQAINSSRSLSSFSRNAIGIPSPTVDSSYASLLVGGTESDVLDYKQDLPFASKPKRVARSELLKDILAIANSVTDQLGHLFYGRADTGHLHGVSVQLDDADVQQWAENAIEPPMSFSLHNVELSGTKVCIVVIRPAPRRPHVAKMTITQDGPLYEGQVWFRRGSKNTVATSDDLRRLFQEEIVGPVKFETPNNTGFVLLRDWFESLGRTTFLGRTTQRDELLGQEYELARHPLNSQEILVGPDSMLFLKPIADI